MICGIDVGHIDVKARACLLALVRSANHDFGFADVEDRRTIHLKLASSAENVLYECNTFHRIVDEEARRDRGPTEWNPILRHEGRVRFLDRRSWPSRSTHQRANRRRCEANRVPIELLQTIPILRILDETKAREFYLDYLGFSVDFEHRFHDNAPLFMGISRGGLPIFLSEHHGDGIPGTYVRIDMRGINELHAELQAKHYRYMNPGIQEQEWGRRELTVYDPFGNRLIFSEPLDE
jgi:uncharacterized glyoxalase superfamily protein PhnB